MTRVRSLVYPWLLWLGFALPALGFTWTLLTSSDPDVFRRMLHPTGEFSARFMIVAMMASPLALLFRGRRWTKWLLRNRRYTGVAAFGYALLHAIVYLLDRSALSSVLSDLAKLYIWTGWLAFFIFVPLAVTSNDGLVRRMGTAWKSLQRWVYAAAALTLVHWAALHDWGGVGPALVHFGPLAALEAYRGWYRYLRKGHGEAAPV
jgi:methionine sulfoxide reductase heme-binding subunit